MGKDRKVHEVVGELMEIHGINEKELAEKAGVSELVVRNYYSGLNKDSRNYARFKSKVQGAFELKDEFFSDEHIWTPKPVQVPEKAEKEKKPEKTGKPVKAAKPKKKKPYSDVVQLFFDQKGQISEEVESVAEVTEKKAEDNEKAEKKAVAKKQPSVQQDPLMSAIKLSGSKAKLSGKKKDITPEGAARWAGEFEEEIKQAIGKVFGVMKESLRGNFTLEEQKPAYQSKKIAELVELASKAKDEDLNLVITMLKKLTK